MPSKVDQAALVRQEHKKPKYDWLALYRDWEAAKKANPNLMLMEFAQGIGADYQNLSKRFSEITNHIGAYTRGQINIAAPLAVETARHLMATSDDDKVKLAASKVILDTWTKINAPSVAINSPGGVTISLFSKEDAQHAREMLGGPIIDEQEGE